MNTKRKKKKRLTLQQQIDALSKRIDELNARLFEIRFSNPRIGLP